MVNTDQQSQESPAGKTDINDMIPDDLLSEDEQVVFAIKPSLWYIVFNSVGTVLLATLTTIAVLAACAIFPLGTLGGKIIQGCGIAVLGRVGFAFLQWVSRTYVLTDRRVIRIRGVFTIDIFQCALVKVQNTFLDISLIQQFLNLGNISFTTAGTGQIEAMWRHVKDPLKVHHQLISAMNNAQDNDLSGRKQQAEP